jgi:hypothetical protein
MPQGVIEELVLVYNADSGLVSALADSARKLLRIKGCTLCSITHGLAGERAEWQECKTAFGAPITYYHRDDVPPQLRQVAADRLPCILARAGSEYVLLMEPDSLERCNGKVADLRGRLRHRASLLGLSLSL